MFGDFKLSFSIIYLKYNKTQIYMARNKNIVYFSCIFPRGHNNFASREAMFYWSTIRVQCSLMHQSIETPTPDKVHLILYLYNFVHTSLVTRYAMHCTLVIMILQYSHCEEWRNIIINSINVVRRTIQAIILQTIRTMQNIRYLAYMHRRHYHTATLLGEV